jgi:hypothetical protein
MNATIVPFGKYSGHDIEDIPSSYCKWAAENLDDDDWATLFDEEWNWREETGGHFESR